MKSLICSFALAVSLVSSLSTHAQGTIQVNNGSFTLHSIPTSSAFDSVDADFVPTLGSDHVSEQWWWFRLAGDTRETPFHAGMAGFTQVYQAHAATLTFNQPGTFNATMQYRMTNILNFTLGESHVDTDLRIDNTSGLPLTISVFNYLDFDVFGAANDSAVLQSPFNMRIDDAVIASPFGRYRATNATSFLAGPSVTGELGLFNNVVNNFGNNGLPFATGNFSGGFQWDITIPAGESFTASANFAITSAVPEPSALALGGVTLATLSWVAYRRRRAAMASIRQQ